MPYVQVGDKWNYICLLIDLYNREIVGHNVDTVKDELLVYKTFMHSSCPVKHIQTFHSVPGTRLNELAVKIEDENNQEMVISQYINLDNEKSLPFMLSVKFLPYEQETAKLILVETTQTGSQLAGVLNVHHEFSIGTHQRDNVKLSDTLKQMQDIDNSLLVVKHTQDTSDLSTLLYYTQLDPGLARNSGRDTIGCARLRLSRLRWVMFGYDGLEFCAIHCCSLDFCARLCSIVFCLSLGRPASVVSVRCVKAKQDIVEHSRAQKSTEYKCIAQKSRISYPNMANRNITKETNADGHPRANQNIPEHIRSQKLTALQCKAQK
ncbi:UvrABC system protein A [Eufriesea mexicana]|uniref:UvrABC system protein A n=1 Tax=Eufriesea mexicana TaxID=516756 RepID=A0A310SGH6_9HYME|nr:UvrABC system protein A [Eufriesea mexicana]